MSGSGAGSSRHRRSVIATILPRPRGHRSGVITPRVAESIAMVCGPAGPLSEHGPPHGNPSTASSSRIPIQPHLPVGVGRSAPRVRDLEVDPVVVDGHPYLVARVEPAAE